MTVSVTESSLALRAPKWLGGWRFSHRIEEKGAGPVEPAAVGGESAAEAPALATNRSVLSDGV